MQTWAYYTKDYKAIQKGEYPDFRNGMAQNRLETTGLDSATILVNGYNFSILDFEICSFVGGQTMIKSSIRLPFLSIQI